MKKIKLGGQKGKGKFAMVDDNDFLNLSNASWFLSSARNGRVNSVMGRFNGRLVHLHRAILNPPKGLVVDHIDGDVFNNQRNNLRVCTSKENSWHRVRVPKNNTTGVMGVFFDKNCSSKPWRAILIANGKRKNLGSFSSFQEAKKVRIEALLQAFGKFSPTIKY